MGCFLFPFPLSLSHLYFFYFLQKFAATEILILGESNIREEQTHLRPHVLYDFEELTEQLNIPF